MDPGAGKGLWRGGRAGHCRCGKIMRDHAIEIRGQGGDLLVAQRPALGEGKGRHHGMRLAEGDYGLPILQVGWLFQGMQVRHRAVPAG